MKGDKKTLVQVADGKGGPDYGGAKKVVTAHDLVPEATTRNVGDDVVLVDQDTLAKLKASGAKVAEIEWSGSMADPDGDPTDTELYPNHVPLTARQAETLKRDGAMLYRVGGVSRKDIASIAEKLGDAVALEVVKSAGRLATGQSELTVKANDKGALALLQNVGTQVIVC